jgi:molecular chaperone DnaK
MENIERKGPDDAPLPQVDETQEIGHAELSFSRPLPKGSPVEITFSLAADGLLSIHGKDLTTYGEIDAEFKTESILSREELEEKKKHNLAINVSS